MRIEFILIAALAACAALSSNAIADESQSLSAQIDGEEFVAEDATIVFVAENGALTLTAATAGANANPPLNKRIDTLSIRCNAYTTEQPAKWSAKELASDACQINFSKGSPHGGEGMNIDYELDKNSAANRFEINSTRGATVEGCFEFRLNSATGSTMTIRDGRFKVEHRKPL